MRPPIRCTCLWTLLSLGTALCVSTAAWAQEPPRYGEPISLDAAKQVMRAAEQKANEEQWPVAIAIVDSGGHLVMFQRLENTQLGSIEIALQKAKTAALYRRPTKAFEESLAEGGANVKLVQLPGLIFEGGLPIIHQGKVIGAIGVSGVQSQQDAEVGRAGIEALQ